MTADISQLCELISEPAEPLALRLSSNLMVGVARVYKIKHEIFAGDVNICFASLRKAMQDLHSLSSLSDAQLQMGQSSVRPESVTLIQDPTIGLALELDNLTGNWDNLFPLKSQQPRTEEDYTEEGKNKAKGKQSLPPSDYARGLRYTLNEHHEHLLSTSFDVNGSMAAIDPSSSQIDHELSQGGFDFPGQDLFGGGDMDLGMDLINSIGDDLARELGEDWGSGAGGDFYSTQPGVELTVDNGINDPVADFDYAMGDFEAVNLEQLEPGNSVGMQTPSRIRGKKRRFSDADKENRPPPPNGQGNVTPRSILSQASGAIMSSSERALSKQQPDIAMDIDIDGPGILFESVRPQKKPKRVKLLLDARTELTDEELKAAREQYLESQLLIRRDLERKKAEKDSGRLMQDMIWGIPRGLEMSALADFWTANFRIQVESRSGVLHLDQVEQPQKRRRLAKRDNADGINDTETRQSNEPQAAYWNDNIDFVGDIGGAFDYEAIQGDNDAINFDDPNRIRSSEEPERGRRAESRPPSIRGSLVGYEVGPNQPLNSGSQRSSLFPWDNAAGSTSPNGALIDPPGSASDRLSLENADVMIRGPKSANGSRRESSLLHSQTGSFVGLNVGFSPGGLDSRLSGIGGEDFQFDVAADHSQRMESQISDINLVTLERNSSNFLEYCKMQMQTLPGSATSLNFNDVVPVSSSTPRVAAAAFYHCLVLATKDLIRLQEEPITKAIDILLK